MTMISVKVATSEGTNTVIVPSNSTIKDAFDKAGLSIGRGVPMLDFEVLSPEALSSTFDDLHITNTRVTLSAFVKHDNASRVRVLGQVVQIESDHPVEDFKAVEKARPAALKVVENDEEVFRVMTCGEPGVSEFGIILADNNSSSGKAYATTEIPAGIENPKAWITDELGGAIMYLDKIDATLRDVVAAVTAERIQIENKITIL